MINTLAGNEDTSPDWIWDSAGRIGDKGYTVEMLFVKASYLFRF